MKKNITGNFLLPPVTDIDRLEILETFNRVPDCNNRVVNKPIKTRISLPEVKTGKVKIV